MSKGDLLKVSVIGAAVGLLVQPILGNVAGTVQTFVPLSLGAVRLFAFAGLFALAPLALWVASIIGRFLPVIYQFAKFAAVGTLNTFVDLGVFNLETFVWGSEPTGTIFAVFKAISFLAATTNSYFWNKYWTFGSTSRPQVAEAIKFYAIAIAGGLVNVGVATSVFTLASRGAVSPEVWTNLVSPLSGIFAALLWNFVGYKFFVFGPRREASPS